MRLDGSETPIRNRSYQLPPVKRAQRCPCYFIRAIGGWRRKKLHKLIYLRFRQVCSPFCYCCLPPVLQPRPKRGANLSRSATNGTDRKRSRNFLLHGPTSDRTVGDRSA